MSHKPYITTAIAYVNAPPHIGFALELLFADCLARTKRGRDIDLRFVTGTDEHGQKILHKALEVGGPDARVQTFVDNISSQYRVLAKRLNISHTDFIRTTEARHIAAAQEMWRRVRDAGFIYKKKYSGFYCIGCEAFKLERELIDGMCPDHKKALEHIEAENYFFKLSSFKTRLQELFADNPAFCVPETKFNEVKQLVNELDESFDVSVSRSIDQLTWGIPVPDDESQVMYVWFDALVNYLTCAGFPDNADAFAAYWPCDAHVIGKEINRFHTMLWPAMLMAAGLPTPKQIAVHGWIHVNGEKMSKSLGNVIDPDAVLEMFGVDGARYLLLSQIPFLNDGDWNWERSRLKYTADLANNLGNLVHRVTSMTQKYCEGNVQDGGEETHVGFEIKEIEKLIETYHFDQALQMILAGCTRINQDIDTVKPWIMAKEGQRDALEKKLSIWTRQLRDIADALAPFMPETAEKISSRLIGPMVVVGEPLFPKIEKNL